MNNSLKMFVVLTLITLFSGGVLSALNEVTAPLIRDHQLKELKAAIADVLPPIDDYDEISQGPITLYIGHKAGETDPVGVAFRVIGNGFQGKLAIMVGVKPNFEEIVGLKVLEQVETPGLGTKIVEDPSHKADPYWFPKQFKGLRIQPSITVIKNVKPTKPHEIQAISGATITSQAVADILNAEIGQAKAIYQGR
jgi:Na+-translocating ferredoxin:NAD+ oxidoreductase subunit G